MRTLEYPWFAWWYMFAVPLLGAALECALRSGGTSQIDSLIIVNTCTVTGSGGISLDYQESDNYQKLGVPALSQ